MENLEIIQQIYKLSKFVFVWNKYMETPDHVKDYDLGDYVYLNQKEFDKELRKICLLLLNLFEFKLENCTESLYSLSINDLLGYLINFNYIPLKADAVCALANKLGVDLWEVKDE